MQPAALLALLRAGDDEPRHVGQIAQLEEVARHQVAPVVLLDLADEVVEPVLRPRQPLVGADDADVVPHEVSDLLPVLLDDDALVGRNGAARIPVGRAGRRRGLLGDLARRVRGALAEDHAFEERIRGEPVRAVQAGAGHLADGEQARDRGPPIQVGAHAAADIMRGRDDGDGRDRHVDAEGEAGRIDVRKVLDQERLRHVRHVEEDAVVAAPLELAVDAARHHVARGKLLARVVALHEGLAGAVAENPALAAQRLGDEEVLRLRMVEAGGVELDELEVGDGRAGAMGHGDAVAGRDVGVRRVEVDLARAAGREDDDLGEKNVHGAAAGVERIASESAISAAAADHFGFADQIDGVVVLEEAHAGAAAGLEQRPLHLVAGEVGGVHHPALRMSALAGEVIAERRRVAGELGAQLDQLAHARGAFRDGDPNGVFAAESCAGHQRVVDVLLEAVARRKDRGDPPLRIGRVGLGPPSLGEHRDGPMPGRPQREGETGDARSQDQEIMLLPHLFTDSRRKGAGADLQPASTQGYRDLDHGPFSCRRAAAGRAALLCAPAAAHVD